MVSDEKRAELLARIEAGQMENEERQIGDYIREASQNATSFVRENPLVTVAGVAVLGLAIGAMTRPGRRLGRQAGVLAGQAASRGLAYGSDLVESANGLARKSNDRIEDLSDDIALNTRAARRSAVHRAGDVNDLVMYAGRKALRHARRSLRDSRARLRS